MDLSTTVLQNPSSLEHNDLADEYNKLSKVYLDYKAQIDKSQQQIYQLKRENELSMSREQYLTEELQTITDSHKQNIENERKKYMEEADDLRKRLTNANEVNQGLLTEIEQLKADAEKVNQSPVVVQQICAPTDSIVSKTRLEYLETVEAEHACLNFDIGELKKKYAELAMQLEQTEEKLANVDECLKCAQENLKSKTDELNEARELNDTLHEQMAELKHQLASYQNSKVDHNQKGNSLFAEVDDQRQVMLSILKQQKQKYLQMKREHESSQNEIRRLRRQTVEMEDEIKACAKLFKSARSYQEAKLYEERSALNREIGALKEKLLWTESKLVDLAETHEINWLGSMLDFCKRETKSLTDEVFSLRMELCGTQKMYSESQELMAKWRFEALRSRCKIIERDLLLEKHQIPFETDLKNIREMVLQNYPDRTKEMPNIDADVPAIASNNAPIDVNNSVMESKTVDVSMAPSPQSETIIEAMPVDVSYGPFKVASVGPVLSKVNETNIGEMSLDETACAAQKTLIDSANKTTNDIDNKENGSSLASELAILKTPSVSSQSLLQFRPICVTSERKKALRQLQESTENETIGKELKPKPDEPKPQADDKPKYQRVPQKPMKSRIIVRHFVMSPRPADD